MERLSFIRETFFVGTVQYLDIAINEVGRYNNSHDGFFEEPGERGL